VRAGYGHSQRLPRLLTKSRRLPAPLVQKSSETTIFTIIPVGKFNARPLLHARKSECWCTRAAALPPPRRRLTHGKHQQGLAGNDPLNTALVAQADQRLRAQYAELALHHSLQAGCVDECIRRLRRRLLGEAVDGNPEVHVVCSQQQKCEIRAADRWFMAEARTRLRSRSVSQSALIYALRFQSGFACSCSFSAAQRSAAQRSAAQKEQKE